MNDILLCYCDSGQPASSCCLCPDGSWYKSPVDCIPPGPVTEYTHPRCYAAQSGDNNCSRQISGEHVFTHSILKFQSADGLSRVSGMHWQRQPIVAVPSKSLVANVLCTRHNEALGQIDKEGMRLFATFHRFEQEFGKDESNIESEVKLFNGEDIERYLIKCACVGIKSGNADTLTIKPDALLPDMWMSVLFRGNLLQPEHGMRLLIPPGEQRGYDDGLGISPWEDNMLAQDTLGITMFMGGFAFWHTPFPGIEPMEHHFPYHDPSQDHRGRSSYRTVYFGQHRKRLVNHTRPGCISLSAHGIRKEIWFSWGDHQDHPTVGLTR